MPDAIAAILAAALSSATPTAAVVAAAPVSVAPGVETRVGEVPVACTGVGFDERADPRWAAYNVRVELSNPRHEYEAGGVVTVRDATRTLPGIHCDAPWLLLQLRPGPYVVDGRLDLAASSRSARIVAPRSGQLRVVLEFPDR